MALGTNNYTRTQATAFIVDQWEDEVREARESAYVMRALVRALPVAGKKGDVFHIPNLSNLSASPKVAGQQVTLVNPTEGEFTITINQHAEVSMLFEDIAMVQEQYNLRSLYTHKMGLAMARSVDDYLYGLRTNSGIQSIAASASGLTEAKILAARQYLDEADAPDEDRFIVVSPASYTDLLAIDRFTRYDALGSTGHIENGLVGSIHGFSIVKTNRVKAGDAGVPTAGGGTTGEFRNIAFQREAFLCAVQMEARVQASYIQEYLATLVTADELFDAAVFRADHAIKINAI